MLIDEQFGGDVPGQAKSEGLKLAMPVEKSGQEEFDFQYDADFGKHIEQFDPDFSKVLVRYNPDGDAEMNERQLGRLKELADWLHDNDRLFLFELLVPAEDSQLEQVGGDTDRYDAELRPELMRQSIDNIQDFGIEVDIWKIEGVDKREDAEMLAEPTRRGDGPRERQERAARAAGRATTRSTTGCARRRASRASSASRSAARSGGTRSRPSSPATSSAPRRPSRSPTTTCASCKVYDDAEAGARV